MRLQMRRDIREQRLLDGQILGNGLNDPVAGGQQVRSSSKLPTVMRAAKDGSKKAAGLALLSPSSGLGGDGAAGAVRRRISSSTTGRPALARCAAMREPMVPAPRTAALRMGIEGASGGAAPSRWAVRDHGYSWFGNHWLVSPFTRQALRQSPANWVAISSGGKRTFRLVPLADPIDRAGDGECGDLGVAGQDRSVVDAFLDERAQAPVDFALVFAHFRYGTGGKVAVIQAHHAASEIDRHDVGVGVDEGFYFFQSGATVRRDIVENFVDQLAAQPVTLEQDFLFVAEIVVKSGFGDVQTLRDIVHRRAAKAFFEEQLRSGLQHRLAFGGGIPAPAGERPPMRDPDWLRLLA